MTKYESLTRCVPVLPLEDNEGLPLLDIYGSVLVEEDLTVMRKSRQPQEPSGNKPITTMRDIFYVGGRLGKIIILRGEAGQGKTVFCLKLLEIWSKAKRACHKEHSGDDIESGKSNNSRMIRDSKKYPRGILSRLLKNIKHVGGFTKNSAVKSDRKGKLSHERHDVSDGIYPSHSTVPKHVGDCGNVLDSREQTNANTSFDSTEPKTSVTDDITDGESDIQECIDMGVFDLVFYIPFGVEMEGLTSVVEMVCHSVRSECQNANEKIRSMLRNPDISCLVILDGIDEGKMSPTCPSEFPDTYGLVNSVLFCTMRSWKMVYLQLRLDNTNDKVLALGGLKVPGFKTVITKVLANWYGIDATSDLFKKRLRKYCMQAKVPMLKSLMQSPLMLISSCLVWYENDADSELTGCTEGENGNPIELDTDDTGDYLDDSWYFILDLDYDHTSYFMTSFYLKLTEIFIKRAENTHAELKLYLSEKRNYCTCAVTETSILSTFRHVVDFSEVLNPICKLAFGCLISKETTFAKYELEREMGESLLKLAMKSGLMSQTKTSGISYQQKVRVSFHDISMQQFLSALHISSGDDDVLTAFCTFCNSVARILEMSNVIMFVIGINPVLGFKLTEHIENITNTDRNIGHYREQLSDTITSNFNLVSHMFKVYRTWYREAMHNITYRRETQQTGTFHITDIYLKDLPNKEEECMLIDMLKSNHKSSIMSCFLDLHGASSLFQSIIQYLPLCDNLTSLFVQHLPSAHERTALAGVLSQLKRLQYLSYCGTATPNEVDTKVVHTLLRIVQLRHMELVDVCEESSLSFPPTTQLTRVSLYRVKMSTRRWTECIESLRNISQAVHVIMEGTVVDVLRPRISLSTYFEVLYESRDRLEFNTRPT